MHEASCNNYTIVQVIRGRNVDFINSTDATDKPKHVQQPVKVTPKIKQMFMWPRYVLYVTADISDRKKWFVSLICYVVALVCANKSVNQYRKCLQRDVANTVQYK